jgi:hypothetical protein
MRVKKDNHNTRLSLRSPWHIDCGTPKAPTVGVGNSCQRATVVLILRQHCRALQIITQRGQNVAANSNSDLFECLLWHLA